MSDLKYYAGIGSRKTPPDVLRLMTRIAQRLCAENWVLRSGGAEGADTAFELGAQMREIYIPWDGFNSCYKRDGYILTEPWTTQVAAKYHPAWDRLGQGARKLMARNVHQILGRANSPRTSWVICWTPGGAVTGGTGQALRHALDLQIPISNLGDPVVMERCLEWLG